MSSKGYVYTLSDPRTDEPVYVGATATPKQRLQSHINNQSNEKLQSWITELEAEGKKPEMNIIRVAPINELSKHEQDAIDMLVDEWDLFNKELKSHYSPNPDPKVNQTTVVYDDDIAAWIDDYTTERDCSKAAAIRYAIRQQMQPEATQ